jgi:hypothetical protein
MYGLVNKAIKGLISSRYGADAWQAICRQAGIGIDDFVRMDSYPDELSYRLVAVASRQLGVPAEQLLEDFGEYWTVYAAQEGYGDLLRANGPTIFDCLRHLDSLHTRVALLYPGLKPPHFHCSDITADSLILHYHSQRPGLAPMVRGLLKGLSTTFGTPVTVRQLQDRNDGADHDVFLVQRLP